MASFVLSFFPLDVLDGIWDLIESVSERFLTFSSLIEDKRFIRSHHNCYVQIYKKGDYKLYIHIYKNINYTGAQMKGNTY